MENAEDDEGRVFAEEILLNEIRTMERLFERLANGANPNGRTRHSDTALMLAAREYNPEAIQAMLAKGGDPTLTNRSGNTAMHFAALGQTDGDVIRLLAAAGGNVNARGFEGVTPLHIAARSSENTECAVVYTLLALGADATALNDEGKTPAQVSETPEAAEMIRRHAEAAELTTVTAEPKAPHRKRRLSNEK
jgi:ankyrin repeat protein